MNITAIIFITLVLLKCFDKITDQKHWKISLYCISGTFILSQRITLTLIEAITPHQLTRFIAGSLDICLSILILVALYSLIKTLIGTEQSNEQKVSKRNDYTPKLKELEKYTTLAKESPRYANDLELITKLNDSERETWEENAAFYNQTKL